METFSKFKIELPVEPAISLSINPKKIKSPC